MVLLGAGCARCGQPYGAQGVRVLAQREDIAFVQLVCFACQIQTLALVTGVPASGDEAGFPAASSDGPRITEADVLEMRSFLAGYKGDMRTLLGRNPGSRGQAR